MKFLNIVKSFDFLGKSLNFTINENHSYKTTFGGFLSFFIYICYIFLFVILGKHYIDKTNPTGYSQLMPSIEKEQKLNLTSNLFLFGIKIQNSDWVTEKFEDNVFVQFTLYEVEFINSAKVNKFEIINGTSCDKMDLGDVENTHFNLSEFICPDFSSLKNKSIYGDLDDIQLNRIRFTISECDITNKTNCKNSTKTEEFFKEKKMLSVIFPLVKYNVNDYEKSLVSHLHNHWTYLDYYSLLIEYHFFSRFLSETDNGDFFENIVKELSLGLTDLKKFPSPRDDYKKDSRFYASYLFFNKEKYFYSRWYLKFQDVLAKVSGIIKIIKIAMAFLYSFYSKYSIDKHICNSLIFLEDRKDERKNIYENLKIKKDQNENLIGKENEFFSPLKSSLDYGNSCLLPLSNISDDKKVEIKSKEKIEEDDNIKEKRILEIKNKLFLLIDKFKGVSNVFKIPYWKYLKFLYTKKDQINARHFHIQEIVSERLYKKLDIINFFEESNKVKIMHKILFDEDQERLFHIVSKKEYLINSEKKFNWEECNFSEREYKEKIFSYLRSEKRDLNKDDEKLMKYLFEI